MIDVGAKYGKHVQCKLGYEELDTQQHFLQCPKIDGIDPMVSGKTYDHAYLFSSQVEEQFIIVGVLAAKFKRRK